MMEEGKISYGEDVQMAIAAILAAAKKAKQKLAKKQKTAYEISLGLVGSEMCIRDR